MIASRKRAEAVKRYLVSEHGLDAQRLKTIGFGEDRPVDGEDASGPENRPAGAVGIEVRYIATLRPCAT